MSDPTSLKRGGRGGHAEDAEEEAWGRVFGVVWAASWWEAESWASVWERWVRVEFAQMENILQ